MTDRPVVAVIGLGTMGRALAQLFAESGLEVRGYDARTDAVAAAQHPWLAKENVSLAAGLADAVRGADVVIEAVAEDLAVKASALAEIAAGTEGIIASNTSTFLPSVLAAFVTAPERLLVAHFFNPPQLVPLVEIVPGPETAASVTARIIDLLTGLGRHPVLLQAECPGFVANRLQAAILREALALVEEGVASTRAVDEIVRSGLAPRWAAAGPIGVTDLGGLDIWERVSAELFPVLSTATRPSPLLAALVSEGRLGAKSGEGFYPHDADADARTFQEMSRHFALGTP